MVTSGKIWTFRFSASSRQNLGKIHCSSMFPAFFALITFWTLRFVAHT